MATVIDGVLNMCLPWILILMGICLSMGMELCGVSALPFAVGVYRPLSISAPIFVGGALKGGIHRFTRRSRELEEESGSGMLFADGAIGGLFYAILTRFDLDKVLAVGPRILGDLTIPADST